MELLLSTDTSLEKDGTTPQSPIKVCMHKMAPALTDYRVMYYANALTEAGFAVTIIDVESEHTRSAEENIHNLSIQHVILPNWLLPTRFKHWFLIKMVLIMIVSTVRLLRTKADIYHAHVEKAFPACYIASRLRRKPLILDTPELTMSDPTLIRRPWLRAISIFLVRYLVSHCAGYITGSPLYPEEIRNLYHTPEVTVIRHVPAFQTVPKSDLLRQHLGLNPNIRIALYQGNLQHNRGLDILVRSAPFLERDVVIVMMGKYFGTTQAQLEDLIVREGVGDRVKIIPPVPYAELLNWTASADIGLTIFDPNYSLSIQKCLPNKVFEYLMAGIPVLSSQLDAIAELIHTYNVGQVVTSLVPTDIAAAINTMLANHLELARMRHNALEAARHEFYWEKERNQLIQLYHNILNKKDAQS